jgi:creatinine amidohydrolase
MGDRNRILWQDLTSPEIAELAEAGAVVIVPVGSIEQHGPHLPVSVDTIGALEVSRRAAAAIDEFPVLVTPPVWWGVSPHHMGFSGTISLTTDTFIALLTDICRSVAAHGFGHILILNGHGGNAGLVEVIAQRLTEGTSKVWVAAATYFRMIGEQLKAVGESAMGGMSHAGEMETSLLLAVRPSVVHMDRAKDELRKQLTSFSKLDMRSGGTVYYPLDLKRESAYGVLGAPSLATAEKGERILEVAVDKLVSFLREYQALSPRIRDEE